MEDTTIPEPTETEVTIVEAQCDLENAEHHVGWFFNPLRKFIIKPLLDVEAVVLPPIAKAVPPLDGIVNFWVKVPCELARTAYSVTHSKTYLESTKEMEEIFGKEKAEKLLFDLSEVRTGLGFQAHAAVELLSDPEYNLRQWKDHTERLVAYLKTQGIEDELLKPVLDDSFFINLQILGSAQASRDNTQMRRLKTAFPGDPEMKCSAATVAKMMRYSCAAYGRPMMDGYDIIMGRYKPQSSSELTDNLEGGETLKKQVCDRVGIPVESITNFHLGAGGDINTLRYYIAVDHDLQAVVLVIRGTFSISGWAIDFQGQSKPFCGGEAHSGIADLATAIVEKAREELITVLGGNPSYKLMVTGQSLGGGLSPLVNILLHMDSVIGERDIECHAFAGPPVYYSDSPPPVVAKAIDNCIHYIHGDDIVPYMGLHQVRRVDAKLVALEAQTRKMGFVPSILTAMGRKPPSQEMVDAAMMGDANVKPIPGGPKLMMPAKKIIWFVVDKDSDEVSFTVCDPVAYSDLPIFFSGPSGVNNHVPHCYEYVLNKAEQNGWQKVLR